MFFKIILRLLAQHLLERNPKERYSALEALDELNRIKGSINNNKKIIKIINESPRKVLKKQNIYDFSEEKIKNSAKSNYSHKFKGIFKNKNNNNNISDFNKNEKREKNDDFVEKDKYSNKKKDNEIRILIKKKNKK